MGKMAIAQVPVSQRSMGPTAADKAHPYAKYLKRLSPGTAELVIADRPIRVPESDAFARAVKNMGGILKAASRAGDAVESILEVIFGGTVAEPWLCAEMERGCSGAVKVEEMRPDLVWFRDGASEILGFAEGLDHGRRELEAAIRAMQPTTQGLVDGKWDAASYRAGIMHGISAEEREDLLNNVYSGNRDWTNSSTLNDLQADCDDFRSTSIYDNCYGMLWDFDDATRNSLLAKFKPALTREWDQGKSDALWAEAQAIRASEPFKSSSAIGAYLAGMAAVVDVHGDGADFIDFFTGAGGRITTMGDAEDLTRATEYALGLILDAALKPAEESPAAWFNLVTGATHQVYRHVGNQAAERIGRAAANLLDLMLPGLEAVHEYQFVVMTKDAEDCLDSKSPLNLCAFQMIMQQLTKQLVILRDNMLARQRELMA